MQIQLQFKDATKESRDFFSFFSFQLDVVVTIIKKSLNKSEEEREAASKLLVQFKTDEVIGSNIFMNVNVFSLPIFI